MEGVLGASPTLATGVYSGPCMVAMPEQILSVTIGASGARSAVGPNQLLRDHEGLSS